MPNNYKIPVGSVGKIIKAVSAAGVAPEELCRAAGLDPRLLADVDHEIPFAQLIRLYREGARLTGDDAFGLHVGEQDDPKLYGVLGYVAINSRDVGEALGRLVRFQDIRTWAYRFSLEIAGAATHLSYFCRVPEVSREQRRHESEETLCSIIRFSRAMAADDWSPREVHFEHARPADVSEHERIFRAPVRFGKPVTKMIFDSSFLKMPIAAADLTLGSLLERQAEEMLERAGGEKKEEEEAGEKFFSARVRQAMRENLGGGKLRIETLCRELGVSTRSLQRQLSDEGTSYQKLLEETQCETARLYLRQPEIAICEISYLLGFSQPSAFHRAFRRWTGLTPKEFRRRGRGEE